jgi:hypothetical protein
MRATYGVFNLTHRDSHEHAKPLAPGERYRVRVPLEAVAYGFPAGHRIAISISSAYWPLAWPSPEPVTLTIYAGASRLTLPVRPAQASDARLRPFALPETGPPTPHTELQNARDNNRVVTRDAWQGTTTVQLPRDWGTTRLDDIDLVMHEAGDVYYQLTDDDPASAKAWTKFEVMRQRGAWSARTKTRTRLSCTKTEFRLMAEIDAWEGDNRVFTRNWDFTVPRDFI